MTLRIALALLITVIGAGVRAEDWPPQSLPAHLQPRVEVIDRGNKTVAAGRDLGAIQATIESRDQLLEETAVKTSYFRLRGYPFTEHLAEFVDRHDRVYVVEQNRDAQLLQLMRLDLAPGHITKLRSVLHYSGLPLDARSITDDVLAQEGYEVAKKQTARMSAGTAGGE